MRTDAIERVLRESSCSSPDTLAKAWDQLTALRDACRAVTLGGVSAEDEGAGWAAITEIGREAER